jgi:hypothetical protein
MMIHRRRNHLITVLLGIAATIYIFKFVTGLFKPNPAIWRCSQVDGGCGYGQNRRASAAMRPKSGGSGRAARSFPSKHLLEALSCQCQESRNSSEVFRIAYSVLAISPTIANIVVALDAILVTAKGLMMQLL